MTHPVVHFEICVPDGERSVAFYRELFGWEIQPAGPDYWLVTADGAGIGGGVMQRTGEIPSYVTVYVGTDSLQQTLGRVTDLGGQVVVRPMEIPGVGLFAMFQDPDGNLVGLFEEHPAEARER